VSGVAFDTNFQNSAFVIDVLLCHWGSLEFLGNHCFVQAVREARLRMPHASALSHGPRQKAGCENLVHNAFKFWTISPSKEA